MRLEVFGEDRVGVERRGEPLRLVLHVRLHEAAKVTDERLGAVVEHLVVTGLHCCAPADYRLLLGAGPRILSVPVDGGIERHGGLVADHLERGG